MKEENVKQEPSYDFYKLVGKFLRFIIVSKSVVIIWSKILLNEPNYVKPYLLGYCALCISAPKTCVCVGTHSIS